MTPEHRQLDGFIDKYSAEVAAHARAMLAVLREMLPGAVELVYDNYNALAIGFSPTDHVGDAVFSLALYPSWVNLFFLKGAELEDPHRILRGGGKVVRHLRLRDAGDLRRPDVTELMQAALNAVGWTPGVSGPGPVIIKSVSAKQRSRTPVRSKTTAK